MLRDIKKLRLLMDKKQKRQMAWLVVMMIIAGFLETVSISLVIPVVSAVMQPDLLETNALVSDLHDRADRDLYRQGCVSFLGI